MFAMFASVGSKRRLKDDFLPGTPDGLEVAFIKLFGRAFPEDWVRIDLRIVPESDWGKHR